MSTAGTESPQAWILVVEDSSVYREMQGLLLRQAGYQVSGQECPQAALEVAEKQHFDLVIIDYELPEMNGQQFMYALRKIQPDVAVIFVSGSLTLELAIQLSGEGVAGIFNKPANPKTLLEKVNETLARNAARDTAARVGSNSPLSGRSGSPATGVNPANSVEPSADQLAFIPRFLPGSSPALRDFTHRTWKVRDFRSVLLLQGEPGSPFESLGRDIVEISIFRDGPVMVCHAPEFDARHLIEVLAPSLLSHDAGTLIVAGIETFNTVQQTMLNNLISGRDIFLPFARRFRLVLATAGRLSDGVDHGTFDETLFYKISSLSLTVPGLRDLHEDLVEIGRQILAHQAGGDDQTTPLDFAPDAIEWLESDERCKNFLQFSNLVLGAAEHAAAGLITATALETVASSEKMPRREKAETPPRQERPPAGPSLAPVNTRPPFPITSALAASAVASPTPAPPPQEQPRVEPVIAPAPAQPAATTTAVAKAPAGQLFSRPAAVPVRTVAARSLFRPASASYQFTERLAECLALADSKSAA